MTAVRELAGPLQARSRRGPIGETWWSRTFIDLLEHSSVGGRLQRGKNYARTGRVLAMAIAPGEVTADVQGSEPSPYRVTLSFDRFGADDIAELAGQVARAPFLVAALSAGTLPDELNQVAARLEMRLLPEGPADVRFSCTCPDWGEPCKHAAAVTYLLAEHLDSEPFDLLTVHGVDRGELIAAVIERSELLGAGERAGERASTGTVPGAGHAAGAAGAAHGTGDEAGPEPGAGGQDAPSAASGFFAAPAPFPRPARAGAKASALDVLDHRLITPKGPPITYWLAAHYERLGSR